MNSSPLMPPVAENSEPPSDALWLSCLMDGELDGDRCDQVLQQLMRDGSSQRLWMDMHIVGDALRSSEVACLHDTRFCERVQARLAEEPRIVAPRWGRERVVQRVVLPGMAVVAAVAVLAVVVLPQLREGQKGGSGHGGGVGLSAGVASSSASASASPDNLQMHRYLQAHREFVPTAGVLPPSAPYLRTSAAAEPRREP